MTARPATSADLRPCDYPELSKLAWSFDPRRAITPEQAFGIYEREWRHVDQDDLLPAERDLIQHLIATVGKGAFDV